MRSRGSCNYNISSVTPQQVETGELQTSILPEIFEDENKGPQAQKRRCVGDNDRLGRYNYNNSTIKRSQPPLLAFITIN